MNSGKIICALIAFAAVALAVMNIQGKNIVEGFGFGMNPSGTWKVDRLVAADQQAVKKGDFYSIPGTYQAILNPRFSNVDYGANIRYNMPSYANQGVPCDPLTFGDMAQKGYKEGYNNLGGGYRRQGMTREGFNSGATTERYGCGSCSGGCTVVSCRKGGPPASFHGSPPLMDGDYASGNYNQMVESVNTQNLSYPDATAMIPVGDMTTVNSAGETIQPIVYDRFMFANRNSRLRSQGDMVRGDIPIVPCAPGWFRPSVQPNIDLQQGAMNVMGGFDNSTARAMADLINAVSGETSIGGINIAGMKTGALSTGLNDVQISAFP